MESLQLGLDEGPCRDAAATRRSVQAADLSREPWQRRWPRFTPGALGGGVRSVIALPLYAGAVNHDGAVDLCRPTPGGWDTVEQTSAAVFTAAVAELLTLERLEVDWTAAFIGARMGAGILDLARGKPVTASQLSEWPPGAGPLACWFDLLTLSMTRRQVHAVSVGYGMHGDDLSRFTLAVHEAMVNAVRHGGGHGQLLLWPRDGQLWCEISDHGPGIDAPPSDGPGTPANIGARNPGRRGLQLIRASCASLDITTDSSGTRLLISHPIR